MMKSEAFPVKIAVKQQQKRVLTHSHWLIRTSDLLNPIQVRYQTALRPVDARHCSR